MIKGIMAVVKSSNKSLEQAVTAELSKALKKNVSVLNFLIRRGCQGEQLGDVELWIWRTNNQLTYDAF